MAETEPEPLILDPDEWMDAPQAVIDAILARTGPRLVINASNSGAVPGSVAQLLLAARRTAAARDQTLLIAQPSQAAQASLTALGLDHLLTEDGV
ncbi:STAS domain-containing protein [Pararhodobacter zhoushanensis]|uniref:STAS domain-containing protein n=1 Tax=Pararhodobacter zhoushanensis TaxID=2479545 RepID=UPI000F8D8BB0|nr:STAS domain-containing protein [Pararhodobacter zhoushanensis]